MTDPAMIDTLLDERKALTGQPRWIIDRRGSVANLAAPVAVKGVVEALSFRATTPVHEPAQTGSCALVLDGRPIQRLSFRPTHTHVNPFSMAIPDRLRGLRLPAGSSRIHRWTVNRVWPRPKDDNLRVAEAMDLNWQGLDIVLAIFLHMCNVDGTLPPAPWEPRLL